MVTESSCGSGHRIDGAWTGETGSTGTPVCKDFPQKYCICGKSPQFLTLCFNSRTQVHDSCKQEIPEFWCIWPLYIHMFVKQHMLVLTVLDLGVLHCRMRQWIFVLPNIFQMLYLCWMQCQLKVVSTWLQMAKKLTGATTVSGTMFLASKVHSCTLFCACPWFSFFNIFPFDFNLQLMLQSYPKAFFWVLCLAGVYYL